ncbi:MAG: hypothetical protein M1608_11630 [Candidatus Omnitrophica bacterium]|nr:hypothetical protein [Candidatus Omnitrophota bacterium]
MKPSQTRPRIKHGLIAFVGYILSPLSWWNDWFINIPLALAFAWVCSLFYPAAFQAALVGGYWLTNVLGLILLHFGTEQMLTSIPKRLSRRTIIKDLAISLLYTLCIVALAKWKILQPLPIFAHHN